MARLQHDAGITPCNDLPARWSWSMVDRHDILVCVTNQPTGAARQGAFMRGLARLTGAMVLSAALGSPVSGQTAAPPPPDPQVVLNAAGAMVQRLAELAAKAAENLATCEDELGAADKKLLDAVGKSSAEVMGALALAATLTQQRCVGAKVNKTRVADAHRDARKLLRMLALELPNCNKLLENCTAKHIGHQVLALSKQAGGPVQSVGGLLAAAEMGSSPAATKLAEAAVAARPLEVGKLVEAAAQAQGKVTDLKGKVADAYVVGDAAAALALAASAPLGDAAKRALNSFDDAMASRDAIGDAQRASNRLVRSTMQLRQPCGNKASADCDTLRDELSREAQSAQATLDLKLIESQERYKSAKQAAIEVQANVTFKDPEEVQRAIRFLRALNDNPDAQDLVGKDSYKVTAGKGGAGLAIKIVNQKLGVDWFRGSSLTLSTPAAEAGNSSLYKSADGFSNASKLELAQSFFRGSGLRSGNDRLSFLHQSGLSLSVGHQRLSYVETGKLEQESTRTLVPWGLSVFSAVSPLSSLDHQDGSRPNAWYGKLSWQRQVEAGDTTITCPVAVNDGNLKVRNTVNCSTGPFGAPKLVSAWQYQLEYRVKNKDGPDFSLALKHNVKTNGSKAVTNIDVPIYLLKTSDDAKSPIHAGLNLGWSSKGGTSFGIFLGAPLSLYAFDR